MEEEEVVWGGTEILSSCSSINRNIMGESLLANMPNIYRK